MNFQLSQEPRNKDLDFVGKIGIYRTLVCEQLICVSIFVVSSDKNLNLFWRH